MPVLTHGPSLLQIGSDGSAHIRGHRQELLTPTLAADTQVAAVPVTVFELQRDDLVSTKPKPRQQQQHGTNAIIWPAHSARRSTTPRPKRSWRNCLAIVR